MEEISHTSITGISPEYEDSNTSEEENILQMTNLNSGTDRSIRKYRIKM